MKRGLVIFQFAISILFVAGTLIVFKQLRFMQTQDLGLNINPVSITGQPIIENEMGGGNTYQSS